MATNVKSGAELRDAISGAQGKVIVIYLFSPSDSDNAGKVRPKFEQLVHAHPQVVFLEFDADGGAVDQADPPLPYLYKTYLPGVPTGLGFVILNGTEGKIDDFQYDDFDGMMKKLNKYVAP